MMLTRYRPNIPLVLESGGGALAAAAVALFALFPSAKFIGFLLVLLASMLFVTGRHIAPPVERPAVSAAVRRRHWSRTPLDAPILLLLLQIGVTFWATALPDKTWVAVCQLGAGLVAYYAIVNWTRDRTRLWWMVAALILLGLGLALCAPFAVDWFRDRKTFLPPALYKFFPLLLSDSIHPNVIAGSLATLMPLPLALLLALPVTSRRQSWLRGALLVICFLQFLVLVLTKSRGGYLALGAGLWLTLWLSGRRRWTAGLTLIAVLIAVWLVIRPPVETGAEADATQAALDASTWAFRQWAWHIAVQISSDFPFTGVGMGTFNDVAALLYGFYSPKNPQAHNLFLQVAVDLGIPGLINFLAILMLVLWAAFQAYRVFDRAQDAALRAVAIGGLAGVVATMAHGLVDSHTWGSKGAFIPWTLMGLVVALHTLALSRSQDLPDRQEPMSP
jgi:putative inorganic carbon (HCO3(-)) transporter